MNIEEFQLVAAVRMQPLDRLWGGSVAWRSGSEVAWESAVFGTNGM